MLRILGLLSRINQRAKDSTQINILYAAWHLARCPSPLCYGQTDNHTVYQRCLISPKPDTTELLPAGSVVRIPRFISPSKSMDSILVISVIKPMMITSFLLHIFLFNDQFFTYIIAEVCMRIYYQSDTAACLAIQRFWLYLQLTGPWPWEHNLALHRLAHRNTLVANLY